MWNWASAPRARTRFGYSETDAGLAVGPPGQRPQISCGEEGGGAAPGGARWNMYNGTSQPMTMLSRLPSPLGAPPQRWLVSCQARRHHRLPPSEIRASAPTRDQQFNAEQIHTIGLRVIFGDAGSPPQWSPAAQSRQRHGCAQQAFVFSFAELPEPPLCSHSCPPLFSPSASSFSGADAEEPVAVEPRIGCLPRDAVEERERISSPRWR